MRSIVLLGVGLCLGFLPAAASRAAEVKKPDPFYAKEIRPFLETHCFDCHGEDKAKGGLRLDTLATDFDAVDKARVWTKVLDRMESGEMPPKKEPRPAPEELARTVKWLNGNLLAADLRAQPPAGSLTLRRLNRLQYENTIHDLLAIKLEVQDRLPPDNRAFGFDNVGAALSLSSAQMETYLEAADAALDAAIVNRPKPAGVKERRPGLVALGGWTPTRRNGDILNLEEAVVVFGPTYFYAGKDPAPEDGQYRVRASLYGYQSQGKPLEVYVSSTHKTGDRVIGFFEVPPDVPKVIEFTCPLKKDAYVKINTSKLRYVQRKGDAAQQTDPGLAVQWVEIEGPLVGEWPPASHQQLFGALPLQPVSRDGKVLTVTSPKPAEDAERLLREFMRRAYRRPVTPEDLSPVLQLVAQQLESKPSFEEAMRAGYKAVLCSPDFLFQQEKKGEPDQYALASRLSYFLWNTMPDEELMTLADRGTLSQPETLRAQVERLLNHPKARGFVRNFLDQWLDLRQIDFTMPDRKLYPEFDTALREAVVKETELFFEDVLKRDLSVTNFVDSDFTFLNERLATHYGIEGVKGIEMRRVPIPPGTHRGGVMTMASVLKVTANGSYTHPVLRGVWVLKNIVGRPPDPPPPNAGAVEPDLRGAKTIREQLDVHRKSASCAGCHVKIDPFGFALENFDVTGAWRDKYRILSGEKLTLSKNGPPVEAAYEMPDGRPFQDIDELKKILLEDKDQLARSLTEKLLIYATGKGLQFSDRATVREIVARVQAKNYGLRSLIHEVVESRMFLNSAQPLQAAKSPSP